jgi:prolyl-tRNA editing enzyme YbaK/EbsC (Cys-tRNA(Pro) deacylase)
MTEEPLGVADVRRRLESEGIEVVELPADTSTAVLAAQALGTSVPAIVKSLLFLAAGEPVLVLASGDRRVDGRVLARELGVKKVRMATPEECIAVAGYAVGGVPPVGHRRPLRTLFDPSLPQHEVVYAAAGAYNAVFAVAPARLQELTGAEITDATAAPERT